MTMHKVIPIDYRKSYKGRRRDGGTKYPWKDMQVGECFAVINASAVAMSNQACAAGKRYGRKFSLRTGYADGALRIERIK